MTAETKTYIWQGEAGIRLSLSLKRQHARRQLEYKARVLNGIPSQDYPTIFELKLTDFSQGPGFIQMNADGKLHPWTLWMFPDSLPDYYNYVSILQLMDGGRVHQFMCRESKHESVNTLLLIEIKGPI